MYCFHWHRLVKNIGWANQNIGEQKVVKSRKCMGVSQLLGARARAAPLKSTPMIASHSLLVHTRSYIAKYQHKRLCYSVAIKRLFPAADTHEMTEVFLPDMQ